ncbi:hypothetical protein P148_SR1C00001G0443 [candidate division SR1 bacterium RAAC1_SR1_1]|nr:hypothetical protein P148_SR1C00001G0443 [candidate division SR1 bacterium RAAC1_SR1_1]
MENIGHNSEKKPGSQYISVTKSFLILSILIADPQGYSMITEKASIYENVDTQTDKQIIEEAVKKTLLDLKSLDQLPKAIQYINKNIQNVPKSIDITPKKITEPVKGIILILGGRKFFIEPLIGKIQTMKLTNEALELETTYLDKKYSREQKLPELCYRLWNTPKGKGEKSGFIGSIITEI